MYGNWQGELVIFQHLVYLWLSGKQKKTRVRFQNCTCNAASFINDWNVPASMVPWSSVHILPYHCGLVRKKEPHHERGSSMQGISYMDDKSGEKQKQQNGGGWDNPEISKGRKLFPPESREDSGRRCLYQRVHSSEQSSEAWLLSEWGPYDKCVDSVDSSCLSCLWLCFATCMVFTNFWLSACHHHQ